MFECTADPDESSVTEDRVSLHSHLASSLERNIDHVKVAVAAYFASKNRPRKTFAEDDFVVIRHVVTTAGTNKKFNEKYRGTYVIHNV